MRMWVKFGFFLSAYLPLFLIIVIKNWGDDIWAIPIIPLILFGFVLVYSIIVWVLVIGQFKKFSVSHYIIKKEENVTKDTLSYLIPYIVSFIAFDYSNFKDVLSLVIFFIILMSVYFYGNLLYLNPLASLFKYRFYQVETTDPSLGKNSPIQKFLLMTKRDIQPDKEIVVWRISENFMVECI